MRVKLDFSKKFKWFILWWAKKPIIGFLLTAAILAIRGVDHKAFLIMKAVIFIFFLHYFIKLSRISLQLVKSFKKTSCEFNLDSVLGVSSLGTSIHALRSKVSGVRFKKVASDWIIVLCIDWKELKFPRKLVNMKTYSFVITQESKEELYNLLKNTWRYESKQIKKYEVLTRP
ncbi:hypothetical protein D3C71_1179830 [compost metagenome]